MNKGTCMARLVVFMTIMSLLGFSSSVLAAGVMRTENRSWSYTDNLIERGESGRLIVGGYNVTCFDFRTAANNTRPGPCSGTGARDGSVSVTCTVNGEPFSSGMRVFGGGHLSMEWREGQRGDGAVTVIDEFPYFPAIESLHETSLGGMYGRVSSIHGILLPGTVVIDCVIDTSATGVGYAFDSLGEVVNSTATLVVSAQNGISVTTPPPIVGVPGREVSTSFTVSSSSIASIPFSWAVSAPCSDWSTYLKVNGAGEAIGVGEVGIGLTLGSETPVTAYFSPTALGNFSCPATMTFYID